MAIRDRVATVVAALGGLFFVAFGLWAFLAPVSFYERIATFPPYNRHLIHDVGAFQIGLGAVLLAALRWRDALFVVLLGVGAGAAVHVLSHIIDRDLGGRGSDLPSLAVLAAVILAAAALRPRTVRKE